MEPPTPIPAFSRLTKHSIQPPLESMKSLFLLLSSSLLCACGNMASSLPQPGTMQRSGHITLDVATSKTSYRAGEAFSFSVRPSADCYLTAWIVGADKKVTTLYPNPFEPGRLYKKNVRVTLPDSGSVAFRVKPPAGRETLVVTATSKPWTGAPPQDSAWLKGMDVSAGSTGGEARVVYEVTP